MAYEGLTTKLAALLGKSKYPHQIFSDDIFLTSFPRSGNTWLSFLVAHVLAQQQGLGYEINFFNIHDFVPEYDNLRLSLRPAGIAGFPRILKSHYNCNHHFPKVILIVRDPRAVMDSYFRYLKGLRVIPADWGLAECVDSPQFGIAAWVAHTEGWLERADKGKRTRVIRYEDLVTDTYGHLARLFQTIGREPEPAWLERAIALSSRQRMIQQEAATRVPDFPLHSAEFRFVRGEANGQEAPLPEAVRAKIESQAAALLDLLGYQR